MNHVGLKFAGQVLDDEGVMRAFVDANATTDAQAFRDVGLPRVLIHDDAFLPVANRWAEIMAFIVALLGLTIVLLQNCNTHAITLQSLSSVLF